MGILKRFKDIMKANVNSILEDAEDPVKMVNQYLIDAREDLKDLRRETVEVMAEESKCKRDFENIKGQVDRFENLAKQAILDGNDGDARVFIEKKQSLEQDCNIAKLAYDAAKDNADKMRALHDKLIDDIQALEERKRNIEQKMAIANASERINKYKGASARYEETKGAFALMEEKANRMLDEAIARGTLNEIVPDEAELLESRYLGGPSPVDAELAAMKEKYLR